MRRYNPPFTGEQFVLNTNTLEVHDLDREKSVCKINDIMPEHIHNCESYIAAGSYSLMVFEKSCNGCAYCMPERHNN